MITAPPAAVQVRRARFADLSTVLRLRLALLREHGDHPVYGRLKPDAERRARDIFAAQLAQPGETVFLAEIDDVAVGILRVVESLASPLLDPSRYGYVSSVYVVPERRRQGIMHRLLEAAEGWCRERALTEMRLHAVHGDPVSGAAWTHAGFDVVEEVRLKRLG